MDYMDDGIKAILNKDLFDIEYYKKKYGDKIETKNYLTHYLYFGYKEGKNPSKDFDTLYYSQKYSDLNDINPLIHYALFGEKENRFKNLDMELDYIKMGIKSILNQNLFDETFYIGNYGDEIQEIDPLSHYISYGYKEGKNPSATFETAFYSIKYRDSQGQNPLIHYALYGRKKGNFTNPKQLNVDTDLDKAIKLIKENNLFDCEFYLDHYDDVKKSGKCPVEHYMKRGFYENRKIKPQYDFENYISENRLDYNTNPLMHFLLNDNDLSQLKIKTPLKNSITEEINGYLESKYFVSVIMPTYNRKQIIENAINSVLNQTFSSYELIIIDDGSTDGTEDFLISKYESSIKNKKIKYIKTNNNGVSKARNIGLNKSSGDIIAYLDSDNLWHADYLKKMIYVLDKYGHDSCYSAIKIHDNNKMLTKVRETTFDKKSLLKENYIDLNVFIHKRHLFDKFGGFDEQLTRLVDWDLILRYTQEDEPYFLDEILAEYYIDNSLKNISLTVDLDENKKRIINKYSLENVNKKHNIAYVLWDFPTISQTFLINELKWLVENKFNVKVFYKDDYDKKAKLDFNLKYVKINDEYDLGDKLKDFNPDVIHIHYDSPFKTLLTNFIAQKLKIPFTLFVKELNTEDNDAMNEFNKLIKSNYCIKILTSRNSQYDYLVKQGISNEKILLSISTNYSIEPVLQKDNLRFNEISMNTNNPSEVIKDNQEFIMDSNTSNSLSNKMNEVNNIMECEIFSNVQKVQNSILNGQYVERIMNTLLRVWNNEKIGIYLVTNHSEDEELDTISDILDKIYRHTTTPFDLLVVDNNSDIKFKEFLKKYSSRKENMEVILLNTNIFRSQASNIALNKLNNEFIIQLHSNENFTLKSGWELHALNLMKNNPNMGIAGNLISFPSFDDNSYKNNEWFKKARNQYYIENKNKKPLNYVQGDYFILRKKVFDELGGFNPKLPQQHWNIEYSYYIESEGWKLGQIPNWI